MTEAGGTSTVGTAGTAEAAEIAKESTAAGAERVVFFSDAVVAIAITLLALDLHVPGQATNAGFWHDLVRDHDDYLGFLISFAVIGNHWFNHHRLFGRVTRVTQRLMMWNMLWLLMIVLTPFATKVLVADGAFAARFALYVLVQAIASASLTMMVREMHRRGLARTGTSRAAFTEVYLRGFVFIAVFLVSIPVAFVTHWAYAVWAAAPIALRIWELLADRRGAGSTARAW